MADGKGAKGLVVVVDDDPGQCILLEGVLEADGYAVEVFHDGESFLSGFSRLLPECVCLDLVMPGLGGLQVLEHVRSRHPQLSVVVLTADRAVESVVDAMRLGAYDYLVKPIERTKFVTVIHNAVERHHMQRRLSRLEREVQQRGYGGLIGSSPAMKELFAEMDRVAASDITVLIHGESGSGKELVARAIHDNSARRSGAYLALNCAAISDPLLESELFGHEKGSFTGATGRHVGMVERADGGTLLLDEVGELSLPLQAKLLRVLQERRYRRVGATEELPSDFRLIAATNRDLGEEVRTGRFREDLFFRIAVFELDVPTLRERPDDIPLLAHHFLQELVVETGRAPVRLSPEVLEPLLAHSWPGNVRELRNTIARSLVVCTGDTILPQHLPPKFRATVARSGPQASPADRSREAAPSAGPPGFPAADHGPSGPSTSPADGGALDLEAMERRHIQDALQRSGGNVAKAARSLGIARNTLYRKIEHHGLKVPPR